MASAYTDLTAGKAPVWLKVTRKANSLSGYISRDGTTWTQIGASQTISSMGADVFIGVCVTSHKDGTYSEAVFDNVKVISSSGTPRR